MKEGKVEEKRWSGRKEEISRGKVKEKMDERGKDQKLKKGDKKERTERQQKGNRVEVRR